MSGTVFGIVTKAETYRRTRTMTTDGPTSKIALDQDPSRIVIVDGAFLQSVADYAVGFLKFRIEGRKELATVAGTGTFTKTGCNYGILTAGHVLKPFEKVREVGLVRFPTVSPPIQNRRLKLTHTESIIVWNGRDCDAPDIGFLKIPEIDGRELEASGAVFYNLDIARNPTLTTPGHLLGTCQAVVGVIGEWIDVTPSVILKGNRLDVGGIFGAAKNEQLIEENGTKLIRLEIDHLEGSRIPKSYGGVSGGGLWELSIELDRDKKPIRLTKKLRGIAFMESANHQEITFNTSDTIEAMKTEINKRWPANK